MEQPKIPQSQFKRKYPRRVFYGFVGVLINGHYFITESTSMGEGGMSFLSNSVLDHGSFLVVTFKIPGDAMISLKGEIKNSRKSKPKDTQKLIYGVQFVPLEIGEKRRIRTYVSARSEDEPII
jgi:hypothetical protein